MSWFRLDDGHLLHPRVRAMGLLARVMWYGSGTWSAGQLTDGHVPAHMLHAIAALEDIPPEEVANCAARLVGVGAWHQQGDTCRCLRRPKGEELPDDPSGYVIHDFLDYNRSRKVVMAERAKKQQERDLKKDRALTDAVRRRDGDVCRYCARAVIWSGRGSRGPDGGTFDHIDPTLGNSVANVVVCCTSCNSAKQRRTPDEAGMVLRPLAGHTPPTRSTEGQTDDAAEARPARAGADHQDHGDVRDHGEADAVVDRSAPSGRPAAGKGPRRPRGERVPLPVVPVVARGDTRGVARRRQAQPAPLKKGQKRAARGKATGPPAGA